MLDHLTDGDDGVRQTVTGHLWNTGWWHGIGSPDHPITDEQRERAAVGLIECVSDPVTVTRKRASNELVPSLVSHHPDPEFATERLVDALEDEHDSVRSNAAEVLSGVAKRRPDLLDPHVDRLRAVLDDDSVRTAVLDGFSNLVERHPELADLVTEAIIETAADSRFERVDHIATLERILQRQPPPAEHAEDLLTLFEESLTAAHYDERATATRTVATLARERPELVAPLEPTLRKQLTDFHRDVRKPAACALAAILTRDEEGAALSRLIDTYSGLSLDEPLPDPLIELASSHPEFVANLLERMRERKPNPPHDTRLRVAEILDRAPEAVRPFLESCANDLTAEDQSVRDGAAWMLGQNVLENPEEGRRYVEALETAVENRAQFDEYARRKMRKALQEL